MGVNPMISYIANINTSQIIQKVCKRQNILILNSQEVETNIAQYIKETKVNFNLIKYLIIDLSIITNSETEIIECIYNFSKIYTKTRIIILAPNYNEQDIILTSLYELGFYNIINDFDNEIIEEKLITALSEKGIQKSESKRFKKRIEVIQKENKIKKLIEKIKIITIKLTKRNKIEKESKSDMPSNKVYLFSLLLEAVTRLVKFISYLLIFILTSIGLTILLNGELRELIFQIFGLK